MLAGACGSTAVDAHEKGTLARVELSLSISGTDIQAVEFEVEGPALDQPLSGMLNVVDTRDPPIWATIMSLPEGEGYIVTLSALDDQGGVLCTGSEMFDVVGGQTNKVDVVLACNVDGKDPTGRVDVDATFDTNHCPLIHYIGATPECIPVGELAAVEVLASDNDLDELQVLWSATAGSFGDATAASTTYFCDGATGLQTLTAAIGDGDPLCTKSKTLDVECGCDAPPIVGPRTPGYWGNWNRCTGGNQAATADSNGGAANGFHLVEDVIPQTVGDLVVDTCEVAVSILKSRDIVSGANNSNDAIYKLARNLLAALFNFAAGAPTCPQIDQATSDGQQLLEAIGFNGTGDYLTPGPNPDRATASALAETIDDYNNDTLCN